MLNGNRLLIIRIVTSGMICSLVIGLAAYLIEHGHDIPAPWWVIGGLAIAGVVGTDVITSYLTRGGAEK